MVVSKEYMQTKYGHLGKLVVVNKNGKYITQIKRKRIGKYCSLSSSVEEAFDKYRQAKEDYIKYLADFYKGDLDYFIYDALYSYKVEITD